jgi:uncharacterized protein (TIGR03382 family)
MGAWAWVVVAGLASADTGLFVADTWDTDFSDDSGVVAVPEDVGTDTDGADTDTDGSDTDTDTDTDTDAPTDSADSVDSDESDVVDTYPSGGRTATALAGEEGGCGCATSSGAGALAAAGWLLVLVVPRRRR